MSCPHIHEGISIDFHLYLKLVFVFNFELYVTQDCLMPLIKHKKLFTCHESKETPSFYYHKKQDKWKFSQDNKWKIQMSLNLDFDIFSVFIFIREFSIQLNMKYKFKLLSISMLCCVCIGVGNDLNKFNWVAQRCSMIYVERKCLLVYFVVFKLGEIIH